MSRAGGRRDRMRSRGNQVNTANQRKNRADPMRDRVRQNLVQPQVRFHKPMIRLEAVWLRFWQISATIQSLC